MSPFTKKATSGGGDFSVAPAGAHAAVLVALIDLGTQQETFQGKANSAQKVFLAWELTEEKNPDTGENFVIGRDYTNSLNEKAALRKLIEQWGGRQFKEDEEFDFTKLLGQKFLVTLVHKESGSGKNYAKIDSVGKLPKSMTCAAATKKPTAWVLGDDPDALPDWLPYVYGVPVREKVMQSDEMRNGTVGAGVGGDADEGHGDEIAF